MSSAEKDTDAGEAAAGAPEAAAPEAGAPEAGAIDARRRRTGLLVGCALLITAVLGGAGYTVVAVSGADRDPGAPVWRFPQQADTKNDSQDSKDSKDSKDAKDAKDAKGTTAQGLSDLLLPYGTDGYTRGPDLNEFGSDTELSGRRAAAVRKEALRGLPRIPRRELEKRIDEQHIEGVAMRSYLSTAAAGDSTLYADKSFAIGVELTRMESRDSVREAATAQVSFLRSLDVFREGPRIEGHGNARCFLPPDEEDEKLDMMICSAYEGDILLGATVYGIKPLDSDGVARFLREQLDRIGEPGQAV
ncbi:hypothetical protein [Streptomyces cavernae]|uniref:hypothetical protein n=1 Tax=Streptomyces cavernae TaxID=2259034 RepID=UPI001EE4B61B|nr:hypothetical protein [Streptomyces cavernae]